jgi:hypothetical protein
VEETEEEVGMVLCPAAFLESLAMRWARMTDGVSEVDQGG